MTQSSDLESFTYSVKNKVDQQLNLILNSSEAKAPSLVSAMNYATLGGGKRVRPLLCFASAQLFDPNSLESNVVLSAACSVELIHAYSLVHDDLPAMDDDDLRRGRATVHKEFDEATAILAGDGLLTLAFEILSSTTDMPAEALVKCISLLAEASGHNGMAGGQMIDLNAVGNQLDIDALINMHSMKTGALIRASVMLGAMAAGCIDPGRLGSIQAYAEKIGLAFQIQDDILDHTSSTEVLGKQQGADAQLGKPTYVSLLGIDGAREKLHLAHQQAIASLHNLQKQCDSEQKGQVKTLLEQIADYIVARTH